MEGDAPYPKIRFFCDLDRTLIYSHRVPIKENKVVVEYLDKKAQSFMTKRTYDFLRRQNCVELIPVTTRSQRQYVRIHPLQQELKSRYALLCNGGVLLIDGAEDAAWYGDSLSLISPELPELQAVKALVQHLSPLLQIQDVSGLFFYFKHDRPAWFAQELQRLARPKTIRILHDDCKVYCLPSELNKGKAVTRFAERFGSASTVAAGDSEFDLPMLSCADIRLIPPALSPWLPAESTIVLSTSVFSDGICDCLSAIEKRNLQTCIP